jgi:uncharacterized protein YqjF (DUF2071 family)
MGSGDVFLEAEWRFLAMLNYEVDPGLLLEVVPPGTELDRWNEKVFISLVGFRFLKTKVWGIPFPFHRNFDEVNLRFYVCRLEGDEIRRGVVFIKEIVPRWLIAAVARSVYKENYVALPMSHKIDRNGDSRLVVQYRWRSRSGWNGMNLSVTGSPVAPVEGSHEQFITEHYWGYAAQKSGGCLEYRVAHPPWKVWSGQAAKIEGDMSELYGPELAAAIGGAPVSAFLAEGSEVVVHGGRKL